MAEEKEECIVCLSDISATESPDDVCTIAHLLPCGHNLHDQCLRPWVERANSCPLCRATFNMVELRNTIDGPTVSSYAVADKVQAPDVDPTPAYVDSDLEDEDVEPCMVCETTGDDTVLLLCDGCNQSCHIHCAGLDDVPAGMWFCYDCQDDPQVFIHRVGSTTQPPRQRRTQAASSSRSTRASRPSRPSRRSQPAQPRVADNSAAWARLWRTVADRTDIDLDFPFEQPEETSAATQRRREAEQREFRQWDRRFRLAARAAGPTAANRIRAIAAPPQSEPTVASKPKPESQEEIKAWNAFEQARIICQDDEEREQQRSKKRKSRNSSPESDRPAPSERKRKRPKTSLRIDATAGPSNSNTQPAPQQPRPIAAPRASRPNNDLSKPPTFLQSLLDEVDAPNVQPGLPRDLPDEYYNLTSERSGSPRSVSPSGSAPSSSPGTPRSMTPPIRKASPMLLTSHVTPLFPVQGRKESQVATPEDSDHTPRALVKADKKGQETPASKKVKEQAPYALDYDAKVQIQTLVKAALKPFYTQKQLDIDQYAETNKNVSRRMYELVGSEDSLNANKAKWEKVAAEEVEKAIQSIKNRNQPQTVTAQS